MIQPTQITNFSRTERELQEFWLFCIMVAGKNSDQTAKKLNHALAEFRGLPFDCLKLLHQDNCSSGIRGWLEKHKIGQYDRISTAIAQSLELDLSTVGLDLLLSIKGVGPKTSRFFLLHSRKDYRGAVLDTHILQWLNLTYANVPEQTPQNRKTYAHWENVFLAEIEKRYPGQSVADADLAIWKTRSGRD